MGVYYQYLRGMEKNNPPLYIYEDGSEGPKEAKELIEKDGRHWL